MLPAINKPQHINATAEDLTGNNGIGRYIFLTGPDDRARELSEHYFEQITVKPHARQHNLYLGTISTKGKKIDVAAISTGMGGPSADIVINELIMLGGRRFLRVGTAGSMQPDIIKTGDVVVATGAVRDDKASWDYIYREYPAIASIDYVMAAKQALQHLPDFPNTHLGIVHSKSSLYAREYLYSLLPENEQYMHSLRQAGVLASEMECAQLFVLSSIMSARLRKQATFNNVIHSGCILAIVGDNTAFSADEEKVKAAIDAALFLSLETTKYLYCSELNLV